MRFFILGLIWISIFSSCKLADLRTDEVRSLPDDSNSSGALEILSILSKDHSFTEWEKSENLKIILTDEWSSSFMRYFTPLDSNSEQLSLVLNLKSGSMKIEFLTGSQKGKIYLYAKNTVSSQDGSKPPTSAKLYFESLSLYLRLPILLERFKHIQILKDIFPLRGNNYKRIFATDGSLPANSDSDQYMYYISEEKYIHAIEFTYRKVFDSYRGFLVFQNYKEINKKNFPFSISIREDLENESFVHNLNIQTIEVMEIE
ncbi:MAG: hypothetical protein H7A24_12430 [Leptospiraceae bacterium]|nr:hypothetical protein [Leptospiraceae bacterium]MCP5512682.1 hypothetical protein [Leptospiraceae bacterium]